MVGYLGDVLHPFKLQQWQIFWQDDRYSFQQQFWDIRDIFLTIPDLPRQHTINLKIKCKGTVFSTKSSVLRNLFILAAAITLLYVIKALLSMIDCTVLQFSLAWSGRNPTQCADVVLHYFAPPLFFSRLPSIWILLPICAPLLHADRHNPFSLVYSRY